MIAQPGEDVAQRQPIQQHNFHVGRQQVEHLLGVRQQISVREHHALGGASGAGGVHDRGQIVGRKCLFTAIQLGGEPGQGCAALPEEAGPRRGIDCRGGAVEDHHALQIRQLAARFARFGQLRRGGNKEPRDAGISELSGDGLCRHPRMGWHVDRPGGHDPHVGDQPLDAIKAAAQARAAAR